MKLPTVISRSQTHTPSSPVADQDARGAACEPSPYYRRKRVLERALAVLLLVPATPTIGLIGILIRLTSRGPAFYRQPRMGRNGRIFKIYKLRTMAVEAETQSGPMWSIHNDPRTTWLGQVLRRLHLDELPQLFNVVQGDMLLTGPRPERPEFLPWLVQEIPDYLTRLQVEPGITGLAQINFPGDVSLDCVRRKLVVDQEYIRTARFRLDVRVYICTAMRLLCLPSRPVLRLLRLDRHEHQEHQEPEAGDSETDRPTTDRQFGVVLNPSDADGKRRSTATSQPRPQRIVPR